MTIFVNDVENGIKTALTVDNITYNKALDICTFETIKGRKGKILPIIKKQSAEIFVYEAFNNKSITAKIVWDE